MRKVYYNSFWSQALLSSTQQPPWCWAILEYVRRLKNGTVRTIYIAADKRWARRIAPFLQRLTLTDSSNNLPNISEEGWSFHQQAFHQPSAPRTAVGLTKVTSTSFSPSSSSLGYSCTKILMRSSQRSPFGFDHLLSSKISVGFCRCHPDVLAQLFILSVETPDIYLSLANAGANDLRLNGHCNASSCSIAR